VGRQRRAPTRMEDDDAVFAEKDTDVDWDLVKSLKTDDIVNKLQQAAKNQDAEQYAKLVTETEKHYKALCGFKVNKDDTNADVENLSFLFELTQLLLESKAHALKIEEETVKKAKDKNKKQRDEIKEYMARIDEQDAEIQELLNQVKQSVSTPAKGKGGGDATRTDAEYKSLQKQVEATKEQLNTVQRELQDEKAKAKELLEKERKWTSEKDKMLKEIEELDAEKERIELKAQDDARREQKTRQQSQKVQKETFKFVKEVSELNDKVCVCEC
jgi:DNA repair exonuclease SbcCD ATPase subunit